MTKSQDTALLILRAMIAVTFVHAAYPKLMFWSGGWIDTEKRQNAGSQISP